MGGLEVEKCLNSAGSFWNTTFEKTIIGRFDLPSKCL